MTSLNLYDFSLANNIEVGIKCIHATKGMIGKAIDATSDLLAQGIEKVKHGVLGMGKEIHPIEKFQSIYEHSDLIYKTQPICKEKKGFQGLIGKKQLDGFDILVNKLDSKFPSKEKDIKPEEIITTIITSTTKTVITETRCISASQIAKNLNLTTMEITLLMEKNGYIKDGKITEAGKLKGLVLKKYMGNDYIAYPENLDDFRIFFLDESPAKESSLLKHLFRFEWIAFQLVNKKTVAVGNRFTISERIGLFFLLRRTGWKTSGVTVHHIRIMLCGRVGYHPHQWL